MVTEGLGPAQGPCVSETGNKAEFQTVRLYITDISSTECSHKVLQQRAEPPTALYQSLGALHSTQTPFFTPCVVRLNANMFPMDTT